MNSDTYAVYQYAVYQWITDRTAILAGIEKQIDQLIEQKATTTGTFIVDVHGTYGSRFETTKELKA